jgi:hypothetical protein
MGRTSGDHRTMLNDAETKLGTVVSTEPMAKTNPPTPQMLVNIRPLDQSVDHIRVPVFLPPGFTRNFRQGMLVKLFYVDGSPQLAVASGHTFSLDKPGSKYGDPVPSNAAGPIYVNPDDMVIHHDETGFFMRWRNAGSTPTSAAVDGSPCIFDVSWLSGLALSVVDYIPPGYAPFATSTTDPVTGVTTTTTPDPALNLPKRAKLTLTMPQGQSFVLDEPADGESTFTYTHPLGAVISVDAEGNIVISAAESGGTVTVSAGDPLYTVYDAAGAVTGVPSVSTVAPVVALGDLAENIPATQAAIAHADIGTFENSGFAARLQDKKDTITALIAAMQASGVPSLPTAAAAIATLAGAAHLPIPAGSSKVKFSV